MLEIGQIDCPIIYLVTPCAQCCGDIVLSGPFLEAQTGDTDEIRQKFYLIIKSSIHSRFNQTNSFGGQAGFWSLVSRGHVVRSLLYRKVILKEQVSNVNYRCIVGNDKFESRRVKILHNDANRLENATCRQVNKCAAVRHLR